MSDRVKSQKHETSPHTEAAYQILNHSYGRFEIFSWQNLSFKLIKILSKIVGKHEIDVQL